MNVMEKSDILLYSLIVIGILFAVIIIPHIQNLWIYYVLNVEGLWGLSNKYPLPWQIA